MRQPLALSELDKIFSWKYFQTSKYGSTGNEKGKNKCLDDKWYCQLQYFPPFLIF